jgi:predicted nuclease with TOPRIM domain
MITDNDVNKLKTIFATKDDLKAFATKDDLKAFATKDDLKTSHEKVMDKLDVIAKELQDFRDEQTLHQGQHDEINERLDRIDEKLGFDPL